MMRFLKVLFKTVLVLAVLGAGALAVLFECCPGSEVTAAVSPYCESHYLIAKAEVFRLYGWARSLVSRDASAEPLPEPGSGAGVESSEEPGPAAATAQPAEPVEPETPSAEAALEPFPTLAKAHWYTRAKVSESSCGGKVVLACVWNADAPESAELLAQAQRIADGFGGKRDFVIFASHSGAPVASVVRELKRARLSFPVCEGGGLPCAQRIAGTPPYFYLVDKKGKLKYIGRSDKAVLTKMAELF